MWVLLLMAAVLIVLFLERTLYLHRGQIRSKPFVDGIKNALADALTWAVHVPIAWVAYTWMGFLLYLVLLTATFDAARGVAALARTQPLDPERRIALSRAIAKIVVATAGLVGLGGIANVARGFELRTTAIGRRSSMISAT